MELARIILVLKFISFSCVTYVISARYLNKIEWRLQVSSKVVESRVQEYAELVGIREHICSTFGIERIVATSTNSIS